MARVNIGTIDLNDYDRDWLAVIAALDGMSARATVANAVASHIKQARQEYMEVLEYTARKHGLTVDECFQKLLSGDKLSDN